MAPLFAPCCSDSLVSWTLSLALLSFTWNRLIERNRIQSRSSRAWRQRDQLLLDKFGLQEGQAPGNFDIDKNSSIVIMTDCIHPKTEVKDKKPLDSLQQALVRHLSSSVPSLAIRSEYTRNQPLDVVVCVVSLASVSFPRSQRVSLPSIRSGRRSCRRWTSSPRAPTRERPYSLSTSVSAEP